MRGVSPQRGQRAFTLKSHSITMLFVDFHCCLLVWDIHAAHSKNRQALYSLDSRCTHRKSEPWPACTLKWNPLVLERKAHHEFDSQSAAGITSYTGNSVCLLTLALSPADPQEIRVSLPKLKEDSHWGSQGNKLRNSPGVFGTFLWTFLQELLVLFSGIVPLNIIYNILVLFTFSLMHFLEYLQLHF